MKVSDVRREYGLAGLSEEDLAAGPIAQLRLWLDQAREVYPEEFTSMTLATADREGRPSARVVLLKGLDERGLVFFTNYDSRKGQELAENPRAALVFYWAGLERQVCVAGDTVKLSATESDEYFRSRPRASRLAAWASRQGEVIRDRAELEEKWKQLEQQFPTDNVPRPDYWGGYVLAPIRFEFCQGRPSRLHDRFRYTKQMDASWLIERLAP